MFSISSEGVVMLISNVIITWGGVFVHGGLGFSDILFLKLDYCRKWVEMVSNPDHRKYAFVFSVVPSNFVSPQMDL